MQIECEACSHESQDCAVHLMGLYATCLSETLTGSICEISSNLNHAPRDSTNCQCVGRSSLWKFNSLGRAALWPRRRRRGSGQALAVTVQVTVPAREFNTCWCEKLISFILWFHRAPLRVNFYFTREFFFLFFRTENSLKWRFSGKIMVLPFRGPGHT